MSTKYPGGFITKSPVAPTTTAASGVWTLDQQQQYQKAGTWPSPPLFIEDLFSTYLYTGNSSTQTITNGIDLSGQGGLVWIKGRSGTYGVDNHILTDTVRGSDKNLYSNLDIAQTTTTSRITAFNSNGFSLQSENSVNNSATNYASWTFREQPKFFDIVTATNTGGTNARIAHNLGSEPGFVIVKAINYSGESWRCYHRSIGINGTIQLNLTDGTFVYSNYWGTSAPTATDFGINWTLFSGTDYIFYFFAHDAGGFPASGSGSTNGISCGSYAGNGSATGPVIDLGYEPQWLLIKQTSAAGNSWSLYDNMRGLSVASPSGHLRPNDTAAEDTTTIDMSPTATGFQPINSSGRVNGSGQTYIYIAIRRGPMKTPTTGTSVYQANTYTGNATANTTVAGNFGFPVDLLSLSNRSADATNWATYGHYMIDRLRGQDKTSGTANSDVESAGWSTYNAFDVQNSIGWGLYGASSNTGYMNYSGGTYVARGFRRAPSFFDEVCYTGTGSLGNTLTHNLGVTPELMIVKCRSNNPTNWTVYTATTGNTAALYLNATDAVYTGDINYWNDTSPTATQFTVGLYGTVNASARTYIAYLFATLAGVSKVGSYTGTGSTQTIDCGFTGGARFVLIKRTDSTGDWYVWDSARGIVAGNDPYLLLNSTAAEVTGTDYVDTTSVGFDITSTAPAAINANGGTFIFLAIA